MYTINQRFRYVRPFVIALCVIALVAGGLLVTVGVGISQSEPPTAKPFGPVLFRFDAAKGVWPATIPPSVVLHARLEDAGEDVFIASGAQGDVALLQSANQTVSVLDANTAGKVYYLIDASASGAADAARPIGEVLDGVSGVLIVATTPTNEVALLDGLGARGIQVSLLRAAALAPPSAERGAGFAASSVAAVPNPAIAALLPQLTEADLRSLVDRLSGQAPATIGGVAVTLNTRHTLTSRVHDAEQFVYEYYQSLGIPVSYFNWTYGSYSGRNVVAEVRGTTNPEKVLLVGGHLDDMSQIPYTTAPGADDNATGTADTLLIARLLRAYRPAVTVRFIHFTGEEQGQWGSKVYAATLRSRGEQVLGFIDLDMIGWDGNGDRVVEIHTASGPKSNALADGYLERNTRYGTGLVFERKTTTASRFSDHSPFWDNDYASFLVIENFFDDTLVRDRNPYYHNTGDLPSRVDFNYVARIGRLTLAALAELAGYDFGGTPPTPMPTATPAPTATPTPCSNLLVNGNFESATAWYFGSTPYPGGYVSSPVYNGVRSVRLGIPSGVANRLAYSTVYQKVTIPANTPTPVRLRYAFLSNGPADGYDYRETLLLNSSYKYLATLERSYVVGEGKWVLHTFDLSAYRGQTVVIYFNVYNNGAGTQKWGYVDRVFLGGCSQAVLDENEEDPVLLPEVETPAPVVSGVTWDVYMPAVNR